MEGEVVAEEQDGGPGGEDEGGVDLGRVVSVGLVLILVGVSGNLRLGDPSREW